MQQMTRSWRRAVPRAAVPVLFTALALTGVGAGPALAHPGPSSHRIAHGNLLDRVAYYTATTTGGFCRYSTPQSDVPAGSDGVGTDSQSRNRAGRGPVRLTIDGADTYTDDGFYVVLGTVGDLSSYTVKGRGSAFGDNLWFDSNNDGKYFTWGADGCLASLGGDAYALGPGSVARGGAQVVSVGNSSSFFFQAGGCSGSSATLAEIKAGHCSGIGPDTTVALWIGDTAGSGGSLSTRITVAHAR